MPKKTQHKELKTKHKSKITRPSRICCPYCKSNDFKGALDRNGNGSAVCHECGEDFDFIGGLPKKIPHCMDCGREIEENEKRCERCNLSSYLFDD